MRMEIKTAVFKDPRREEVTSQTRAEDGVQD